MHASHFEPSALQLTERELGLGRRELILRGPLPVGWCESLTAHLSARGASVDRIVATSDARRIWEASIVYLGGRDVDALSGLAEPPPESARDEPIPVEGGEVWVERDGSVGFEIHGRDRRGLLAALLRGLAMRGLFPVRVDVQTQGDRVLDRFVLRGFSGAPPSEGAVRRFLDELLHPVRHGRAAFMR